MPKRRTAAQRAASRRNLVKARAAKRRGVPTGKMTLLVHFTNAKAKKAILKEGFKPSNRASSVGKGHVFGTPYSRRKASGFQGKYGYGHTGVVFSVPRKLVKQDADWPHPDSRMVDVSAIKGRKIRGLRRGE